MKSDYAHAYDNRGEPPPKTVVFFTTSQYGMRCNAVGGRFGYGYSFPVKRSGDTFLTLSRFEPTGKTYVETLTR